MPPGITRRKFKHSNNPLSNNVNNVASNEKLQLLVFSNPSENQGFKYLYIPTKARVPVGTLRTTFRKLGVNNARLLDIHYPACNTVAILIHNDYETDFIDLLRRHNIPTKADFNPSSGSILAYPKFTNLTPAEREATASTLQRTRIARARDHIRAPVKFAVARFFLEKQWISKSKFDSLKTDQHTQLAAIFGDSSKQPSTQPASPYRTMTPMIFKWTTLKRIHPSRILSHQMILLSINFCRT
jgi:hypothetical protein